jgi:DNA-binding response OmpR family regulator
MRILVVEDDQPVAAFVRKGLIAENYAVDVVGNGEEAKFVAEHTDFNLLVLDLALPGVDGLEVLRHVRAIKPSLPILVLTGRASVEERIRGLDLGADDYMIKPFSFSELAARVRTLLRRGISHPAVCLKAGDLEINRVTRVVTRRNRRIDLTPREFALLEFMMRNAGRTVTRTTIIEHVWNFCFDPMTNVVDVYVNYLRKKVDGNGDEKLIHTVRGVGYQLSTTPPTSSEECGHEEASTSPLTASQP